MSLACSFHQVLSTFCLAPVPRVAADDPATVVLGHPVGEGDGADARAGAVHDLPIADVDADMAVGVTGSRVGAVLGGDEHTDLDLRQVRGRAGRVVVGTVPLVAELAVAVAVDGVPSRRVHAGGPSRAQARARPLDLAASVHDALLPLLCAGIVLPTADSTAEHALELLDGHTVELGHEWVRRADGPILREVAAYRRGVVAALAEGLQEQRGVIPVDGLLVVRLTGVVRLLVKVLASVGHVRLVRGEHGEAGIGLVGGAGRGVFRREQFDGPGDETAVAVTGILDAAVVVILPAEEGAVVRGAVLNHHLAEEGAGRVPVLVPCLKAGQDKLVGDPVRHPVEGRALALLLCLPTGDGGDEGEDEDDGEDTEEERRGGASENGRDSLDAALDCRRSALPGPCRRGGVLGGGIDAPLEVAGHLCLALRLGCAPRLLARALLGEGAEAALAGRDRPTPPGGGWGAVTSGPDPAFRGSKAGTGTGCEPLDGPSPVVEVVGSLELGVLKGLAADHGGGGGLCATLEAGLQRLAARERRADASGFVLSGFSDGRRGTKVLPGGSGRLSTSTASDGCEGRVRDATLHSLVDGGSAL